MLNMDNLNKTNEWAKRKHTWTVNDILASVAKLAVYFSYPRYPRKLEAVITKLSDDLTSDPLVTSDCVGDVYMVTMSLNELIKWIDSKLRGLKEYREWNLTTYEYEHGVDIDGPDEQRMTYYYESPVKDFIDLEAFMQNLYCELRTIFVENEFFHGTISG